ncbi:MAG: hypothetical protein WA814_12605, partial [Candidatus Baltobacteraceae bacterium]
GVLEQPATAPAVGPAGRPSALPPSVRERLLATLALRPRPVVRFHRNAKVGLWVSSSFYNYIFGQSANGKKTLTAIDAASNACYAPTGIKVDHAGNLWVACYGGYAPGAVQEYPRGSKTPSAVFEDAGCAGSGCSFTGYPLDEAFDRNGNVFATNAFVQYCNPSCEDTGDIAFWSTSAPSAPPALISDPNLLDPYFMDVDNAGNLYVDGYGCLGSACGYLLDEISNPTTAPAIVNLIAPRTIGYAGGVYVSNGGTVLNLIDQDARTISQYALPWVTHEQPFNVLGPTPANYFGLGDPVSGGFNQNDTSQADADSDGWIDIGKVSSNRFTAVTNINLNGDDEGAAYVPSDK